MPTVNGLKKQVDLPVWEWMRFAPTSTSSLSAMSSSEDGTGRYFYYLVSSLFYRYDTWSDQWTQLASPITTPVTITAMRYSPFSGSYGRVIAATSTTLTTPSYGPKMCVGYKVQITEGPGRGQERTISDQGEIVIYDQGVPTTSSTVLITDTTKRWKNNQWTGYTVKIRYGTGITQSRTILYNTENTIVINDANYIPINSFGTVSFVTTPAVGGGTTASHYTIESSNLTVSLPWTVQPDANSRFKILSGGMWLVSGPTGAPFINMQYYDVLTDAWISKTTPTNLVLATIVADGSIQRMGEFAGQFTSGTTSTATSRLVQTTGKTWVPNEWANFQLRLTSGTGAGQRRRIVTNTADAIYVNRKWEVTPDATTTYEVYGDSNKIWFAGNGNSSLLQYSVEFDNMYQGHLLDGGVVNSASVKLSDWQPFAIATGVRNATSITAVSATPTASGSNYKVGDVLTVTEGTLGRVFVETINATGGVLTVSLYSCGSGGIYTVGVGKTTSGGSGTGCTISITTVGVTSRITTITSNSISLLDNVTISGLSEGLWNGVFTVIGMESNTIFSVASAVTANAIFSSIATTTLLVDTSSNWDVNEYVGQLLQVQSGGTVGTATTRRIVSNTATTITVATAFAAMTTGTSRYIIHDIAAFGRDVQNYNLLENSIGQAASGSTTTLIDSTKNWQPASWVGYRFQVVSGTGLGNEIAITANTNNTLTYATQTFSPDATTRYRIMDTFGIATAGSTTTITDTTKNWQVNRWSGKRVRITGGTGQGLELTITSNTSNILTFGLTTALDTSSTYTILSPQQRGAGIEFSWLFGLPDITKKGKSFVIARGGGTSSFDKYLINSDSWEAPMTISPQQETLNVGSMYCYDGKDRIYFTKDATGRIYYLDLTTNVVNGYSQVPYGMSTAIIGNRMEIMTTDDGLQYLYVMRHSAQEMWRTLLFS
jgi:hypothetical protein